MSHDATRIDQRGLDPAMRVAIAFLIGVITLVGILIWEATSPSAVIAQGDAGTFNSATSSAGGFFAQTLTSVQTTAGTVTVTGTFSAPRDSRVVVEERNKTSALRLCVIGSHDVCAPLAGTWSGPMAPTPQAAHAILFARDGLSTDRSPAQRCRRRDT